MEVSTVVTNRGQDKVLVDIRYWLSKKNQEGQKIQEIWKMLRSLNKCRKVSKNSRSLTISWKTWQSLPLLRG